MPALAPSTERWINGVMLLGSLTYLATEVAFTSYLIEFLGAPRTPDQILDIEQLGRKLTGIALALIVLNRLIKEVYVRYGVTLNVSIFIALLLIPTTFYASYRVVAWGIEEIVTYFTDATTASQRHDALLVTASVDRMHAVTGKVPVLTLHGDFIPETLTRDPESRVFLAALPFLLSKVPDLKGRLMDVLERSIRGSVQQQFAPEKTYNALFVKPMREFVGPTYAGYVEAVNAYRKARYERVRRADVEFDEYREELARYRLTIESAKARPWIRKKVAERVIAKNPRMQPICARKGIPDSVADFDEVIAATIDDEFAAAMHRLRLEGMTPAERAFTLSDFVRSPHVTTLWKTKVVGLVQDADLAGRVAEFGPRLGASGRLFQEFQSQVLTPYINAAVTAKMADLTQDINQYVGDDPIGERAYNAMKSIVVIPIAIIFSMLGAIAHTVKVTGLMLLFIGLKWLSAWISAAVAVCLVISSLAVSQSHGVASWPPAKLMLAELRSAYGLPAVAILRTTFAVQPRLYPIGLEIRQHTGFLKETL